MKIRLQQGQVWKRGEEFLRIVHLKRLEVEYKSMTDLASRKGTHHHVSKKEFCRLIKGAALLTDDKASPVSEASSGANSQIPASD